MSRRSDYFTRQVDRGDPTGCWPWLARRDRDGYGRMGQGMLAHRFAWELANGPIPAGMHVLHRCDNRACMKTESDDRYLEGHLFLGTHAENMADMATKGRACHHPGYRRLSEAERLAVVASCGEGEPVRVVARRYRVATHTVRYWLQRKEAH